MSTWLRLIWVVLSVIACT